MKYDWEKSLWICAMYYAALSVLIIIKWNNEPWNRKIVLANVYNAQKGNRELVRKGDRSNYYTSYFHL